jgi:serine phosphatase RsbU (regulator of sigma subunit)
VFDLLQSRVPRLGYAVAATGPSPRFAVYGESALPTDRRSRLQSNTAFSDLDYAVYLGRSLTPAQLLVTNLNQLPVQGRQAQVAVAFGDAVLTVVVTPRVPLSGALPQRLPWIILVVGLLLSLGAAALTARLIQGRLGAEHLAGELEVAVHENQELYAEQRTIAQTLQHALLPAELPHVAGTETSGRYEPGEQGVEIGGDWYDVIPLDDHRLLTVVGDVSGRGLRAATTMASLRYAIHAYAAQSDSPATILTKLSGLLSVTTAGQFATVLCTVLDVDAHEVTVASAGHLPPLLISEGQGEYLEGLVGPPIGVQTGVTYAPITVAVPAVATLLAFTDGLVERRGESIDDGLARLRNAALTQNGNLAGLLNHLVNDLRHGYSDDDTAIVGLRWTA